VSDVEEYVEHAKDEVETRRLAMTQPRRTLGVLRRTSTIASNRLKRCTAADKPLLLSRFKQAQDAMREQYCRVEVLEREWTASKRRLYFWNKMFTAAKSEGNTTSTNTKVKDRASNTTTTVTWDRPEADDTPRGLDASRLLERHGKKSAAGRTQIVATWGEDPGVVKMSENTPLTVRGITSSINRYHALQGELYLKDNSDNWL
jgi:hypothetical protein